jgi:hypothetical protein
VKLRTPYLNAAINLNSFVLKILLVLKFPIQSQSIYICLRVREFLLESVK